jgi:hypothetical protein
MTERSEREDRAHGLVTVGFALVAVVISFTLPGADDEGYLTFIGASAMSRSPLACLFFQKFHPALSALYLIPALFGWQSFRTIHALVAAGGVFFVGDATRRLGGTGWVAALMLALSPAYVLSAASGQSNTDGVTLFAFAFALAARGGPSALAACAVAGAAPWARYEFAVPLGVLVLALVFAPELEPRERARRLLAASAPPLTYLGCGALYHHDPLWFVHFTPNITAPIAGNPSYHFLEANVASLATLLGQITLATVGWPFLFFVRPRALPHLGRALLIGLAAVAVLLIVLPLFHMFFEGLGVRYMLAYAPLVAPLVGLSHPSAPRWRREAVLVALTLPLAALPFVSTNVLARLGARTRPFVTPVAAMLEEREGLGTVYTDSKELALLLRRSGHVRSRFIPSHDILTELSLLADHDNGQYDAVMGALDADLYGPVAWPCALGPFERDDVFVLTHDRRFEALFPPAYWERYTEVVETHDQVTIRRPRDPSSRMPTPTPAPDVDIEPVLRACDHLGALP